MTKTFQHFTKTNGSGFALALSQRFKQNPGIYLVLTDSLVKTSSLALELKFFLNSESDVHIFPDWEVLAFDSFSPQPELVNKRMEVLANLIQEKSGIYITALTTALIKIMPKNYFLTTEFNLKIGQELNYEKLRSSLISVGYNQVETVMEPGEFSTRGSLIDIYPSSSSLPYRLDLFGDEIESLKIFEPESQRSIKDVKTMKIHGASEYPLGVKYRDYFATNWKLKFPEYKNHIVKSEIVSGNAVGGVEFFLPLFFDKLSSFFSYIPEKAEIIAPINHSSIINTHLESTRKRQKDIVATGQPCLETAEVYLQNIEVLAELKAKSTLLYNTKPQKQACNDEYSSISIERFKLNEFLPDFKKFMQKHLAKCNERVILFVNNETQKNYYANLLQEFNPASINTWDEFLRENNKLYITKSYLTESCYLPSLNTLLISEHYLDNDTTSDIPNISHKKTGTNNPFDLTQINVNDFVVHEDYGIGRYLGLTKIKEISDNSEYVILEYANEAKIYVPITDLSKIYIYNNLEPELATLGSKKWQKKRKKAIEKMIDSASELLDLYSKRKLTQSKKYNLPDAEYYQFAKEFPFTETDDQLIAINDIIKSLSSEKLTDRLICGDVGFGKTEIAMRAAFLAVASQLQVVLIAPTTLLASQHFNSFKERFTNWPITISLYSSSTSTTEIRNIESNIKTGSTDIIIATHKILSNKLKFKNLGLLIIDEEHRFGVKQKEKLKSLKVDVDVISLTATPIPRTLQLAYTNLRDLSIIATPPQERLPIQTYISTFDEKLVVEAVTREINRGGQVYYLYNEVSKITTMSDYLTKLLPELKIVIAHGQMPKAQLTAAMTKFYKKQAHICLCSTIVESGIDVQNANTIIIDRADKLGLAQLHQIRGRVGRSSHQAYAYLFTPNRKYLTPEALQRLDAISKHNYLGSGFQLAILDMEIRGAGELLGDEQSGHIKELGFDYYISLINDTTEAIKHNIPLEQAIQANNNIEIDTYFSIVIPDTYISNPATRLNIYKKTAKVNDEEHEFLLANELEDIYGKLPDSVRCLLKVNLIKNIAHKCDIKKIKIKPCNILLTLGANPNINTDNLLEIVRSEPEMYRIKGPVALEIISKDYEKQQQLELLENFITRISTVKQLKNKSN
ncbi:MAG: transcription-repair coupling factor [Pseudomonadota bacterium]|nr:transcription-repair coupling factor [Pseudomonadota bacterium]